jgi:hypothetical protein
MLAKILKDSRKSTDLLFVFANTGLEDPRTLDFAKRCDTEFGLNLVWVEAKVDPQPGIGTSFSIVNYETASRNGEPYERVIEKYGIPSQAYPNCNRELKLRPIHAYVRSIGWETGTYQTAIGIRADEIDRISKNAARDKIIYPLMKLGVTKQDVISFWREQSFDLYIPEHFGNCVGCWKKSFRKLMTVAVESPSSFDFFRKMENLHGFTGPGEKPEPRKFYRGQRSVDWIFAEATKPFEKFIDGNHVHDPELDTGGGCGGSESCDIFTQETENDILEYDL